MPLFCAGAVDRMHADPEEVAGLDQLREHAVAVEGRAGAVVGDCAVVVHEANHAQVFDAVAFIVGLGKNDHLGRLRFPGKLQLIVRLGQPADVLERRLELKLLGRRVPRLGDGVFELRRGEGVGQPVQHERHRLLADADVFELAAKQRLVVLLVGNDADGPGEASAGVDLDLVIGSDDAGAEDDRRHVPLARGPETHNEPHRAGGQVALVVMRDDRRIEQRRRLDRILGGQVGPDQQAAIVREVVRHADHRHGRAVILLERGGDVAVAGAELQKHLVQQPIDLPAAQTADPIDEAADPRLPAGIEETGNDAANIAGEGDRQTPDAQEALAAFVVC